MSKRNRRQQKEVQVTPEVHKEIVQNSVVTNGLEGAIFGSNGMLSTQLSQADTLMQSNRWYLISNLRQLLSELYVEHGLIQTVCELPVLDGLRGGVEVSSNQLDPDQVHDLQAALEMENDIGCVGEAAVWTRLFGGGAVIVNTDQDPSTELDIEAIGEDSPLEFTAVDLWELFWDRQIDDYSREAVVNNSDLEPEYFSYYGIKIHKSRVFKMKGKKAPSFVRPRLYGWGMSVVERMVRSINQYLKSTDLTFEVLDEFKIDIFRLEGFNQALLSPDGEQRVRKRISIANSQKNYQNALTLDKNDEYDQKQVNFVGIAETQAGIRMQLASDLRFPLTKLFGISSAGFSSGEDDIENYNAMVESEVRTPLKKHLLKVIGLRCQKLFGFIPDDLSIEYKPLRILSSEQQENVKDRKFGRLLQAKQAGEITTKEFRDGINKEKLLPLQLEEDEALEDELARNKGNAEKDDDVPSKNPSRKSVTAPKEAEVAKNSIEDLTKFNGPRIVTVGLISGNEILCGLRRDNGLWTNPGGHMDEVDGNDIHNAAIREVFEETGIKIARSDLKKIHEAKYNSHRSGKDFVVFGFLAAVNKENATAKFDPDKEFSEFRWVKISDDSPELFPENRHAKQDCIIEYVLKTRPYGIL